MSNNTATMQESFPMTGGDGSYSYANNSYFQRQCANASKSMIEEAIAEKLDVQALSTKTFCLADLGCSVGPNTFVDIQHIVGAVERRYLALGLKSHIPEFQVFFNDHAANDFNTLFASLPTERRYFACGVPDTGQKLSPAWNEGFHHTGAPYEVAHAYAAQFDKDTRNFLNARAKELVVGGIMVLIMSTLPDGTSPYRSPPRASYDILESCLMETGIISEAQADSFNHPLYRPSLEQLTALVERNGCFSIERMELTNPASKLDGPMSGHAYTMHVRATIEGLVAKHFRSDLLINSSISSSRKLKIYVTAVGIGPKEEIQRFVVLKRK
ncbi:putative S-adenosylmethionine-dependent methyltransferase [Vitis vinifera]|uniref:Putative S-adenosylmethionine-dependent methyltransferase n=1 Tax=Vitis vinifera TaxID=29760 RepID=A0A438HXM7_VITVI|nr:putative S-adenosylmethionine-dependent methyltransferase [Vitis vinifera]